MTEDQTTKPMADRVEVETQQGVPAEKKPAKTTYYDRFPMKPRANSNLVHVFWAVKHDHRTISVNERRNVVYPAKRAGLMDAAPEDEYGVRMNKDGHTSRCGFILTPEGERYYKDHVLPILPDDFSSEHPCQPSRKGRKQDPSIDELKALA